MQKEQKGAEQLKGIGNELSGNSLDLICQKNGVIRVPPLSVRKRNSKKSNS